MMLREANHRGRSILRALPLLLGLGTALTTPAAAEPPSAPIDLALYASLLERHTRSVADLAGTRVDYAGLQDSADWETLLRQLESAEIEALDRTQKLAFWINVYNILAIEVVRRSYPVESIRDVGSFFSPVWKKEILRIGNTPISLDHVEHTILRPMGEPRIHAAIVCAATSCPPLARTPFRSETLDEDLDAAMRRWLASPQKGISIDRERKSVRLSKIFDWFEEDFEAGGGVLASIAGHLSPADASWLRRNGASARIRYMPYDWTLNDLRGRR